MKYSNEILNDSNFDSEVEKLAEKVGQVAYEFGNGFVIMDFEVLL